MRAIFSSPPTFTSTNKTCTTMAFRSYHGFRPYVPVAQRRLQAQKAAKKMAGKGRAMSPVQIDGRAIATTFWGQAWCKNLESYSDYANRLPRGRTYVRNGSVIDLQIAAGAITALVQGSSLYTLTIKIDPLEAKRWRAFKKRCAGRVTNLLDLLQGRLSKEILTDLTARDTGLFPAPAEIDLGCSCPDWADMCKHVAAVLYGVGARLDQDPALFFILRGVDMQELITAASTAATADLAGAAPADTALADADLAAIFGVELDTAGATPAPAVPTTTGPFASGPRARQSAKPAAKPGQKPRVARNVKTTAAASGKRVPLKPVAAKKKAKRRPQPRAGRSPSR
jgi:uncharacterized Zn finger protein